jgi:hypothetical protein
MLRIRSRNPRLTAVGIRCVDHAVGIVRLWTKSHGVQFSSVQFSSVQFSSVQFRMLRILHAYTVHVLVNHISLGITLQMSYCNAKVTVTTKTLFTVERFVLGSDIAQAISHRFDVRSDNVRFVVDKVAFMQVFCDYFGFHCKFSFHQLFNIH